MIWLDAQLSPTLALWIRQDLGLECVAIRDIGLRDAADSDIFHRAKTANAVVVTKDRDFVELLFRLGPPPKVIWLTCGNTSKRSMMEILRDKLYLALEILESGENLVEIQ